MDPKEQSKTLDDYFRRRSELSQKIVDAARTMIPVLKDAGRSHSAATLDELFFQLDALEQELHAEFDRDPARAIDALLARIRPPRRPE
jgi:uncharacterized protein Yka (UPF0111/DUF47 family)